MSLFKNLIQVVENLGRNKSQTQVVDDGQATQLVNDVDAMIQESFNMITSIQGKVSEREFKTYKDAHDKLYVMVVDVKSDLRDRGQTEIVFASADERDKFYQRIRKVLVQCKTHHTDVLSASRKAHSRANRQSIASTSGSSTTSSSTEGGSQGAEWLSVVSQSNPSSDPSEDEVDLSEMPRSDTESSNDSRRFLTTVAHIPTSVLATEEELRNQLPEGDDDKYYRILICGNKRKRAVVIDPKPHSMSANHDDEDAERSQADILRVGDMLMRNDPQHLEGSQVIQSYEGPSFISSFISSWGPNSMPAGGMV